MTARDAGPRELLSSGFFRQNATNGVYSQGSDNSHPSAWPERWIWMTLFQEAKAVIEIWEGAAGYSPENGVLAVFSRRPRNPGWKVAIRLIRLDALPENVTLEKVKPEEAQFEQYCNNKIVVVKQPSGKSALILQTEQTGAEIPVYASKIDGKWTIVR